MTNHELERARAELDKIGADFALLSSGDNITYVSHWEVPIEFGPASAMSYEPPLALIGVNDSASSLLVSGSHIGSAQGTNALTEVLSYDTFNADEPISARDNYLALVRDTLKKAGLKSGTLAIEEKTLPAVALRLLTSEFPNVKLIEAGGALAAARKTKTERELGLLRFAAEVNKAGHTELLHQSQQAGKSEFEMWAAVVQAMEMKAGHTLFVFGELVTGISCRFVQYPGGPKHRITKPGDLALMDMSPRVNGYWSDTTNTMVVGGVAPTELQKRYGTAARDAFHAAAEMLRPGHKAHKAYDAAEATFQKYGLNIGHYAGHQIGASINENPRLVPYEQTVIEAGMVFSIEPGAYEGENGQVGARMEKSIIVHDDGPELICDFQWGF